MAACCGWSTSLSPAPIRDASPSFGRRSSTTSALQQVTAGLPKIPAVRGRRSSSIGCKSPTIEVPIHLDVNAREREAELERVLQRGGSLVETKSFKIGELGDTCTVMRDPEGNGFCLEEAPDSARNHIWNVTFACAQPRELGRFWAFALGWPDDDVDSAITQQFRDAGVAEPDLSGFHVTKPLNGGPPRLYFHRRGKSKPASYPIHLDFGTENRAAGI